MGLQGQGVGGGCAGDRGYAMAALLVSIGVLAILMSVALPVWRHEAQREKEAELVFRGEQYARAVMLYQRKMGPGAVPPSVDVLVQQKFLRKKYKDPMVADGEFQIIPAGGLAAQPGQPGLSGGTPQRVGGRSAAPGSQLPGGRPSFGAQAPGQSAGFTGGGVIGVVSKSKEQSIRIYRGASYYNQWRFIYVQAQPGPGRGGRQGMGPGRGGPVGSGPGMGRPGRGPGQDGRSGFPFPGGRGAGGRGRGM